MYTDAGELFRDEHLKQELKALCKSTVGHYGITACGEDPQQSPKTWYIRHNEEDIFLSLEKAKEYLQKLRDTSS